MMKYSRRSRVHDEQNSKYRAILSCGDSETDSETKNVAAA